MRIATSIVLAAAVIVPAAAQIQNPVKAAKEAWNKARQEQQQRQQQQKPQQPATAPATAQTSSPLPPGSSQPVTLSEQTQGPVQIADWKAMPAIVGVHLHMPLEAAVAHLKEQYPKLRFQPWLHTPLALNIPQKQFINGVSINYGGGGFADQVNVNVTQPPNAQVVWQATRQAERQNIHRGTLLAALREKYGKETFAQEPQRSTTWLWWLFNEQGKPSRPPALVSQGSHTAPVPE